MPGRSVSGRIDLSYSLCWSRDVAIARYRVVSALRKTVTVVTRQTCHQGFNVGGNLFGGSVSDPRCRASRELKLFKPRRTARHPRCRRRGRGRGDPSLRWLPGGEFDRRLSAPAGFRRLLPRFPGHGPSIHSLRHSSRGVSGFHVAFDVIASGDEDVVPSERAQAIRNQAGAGVRRLGRQRCGACGPLRLARNPRRYRRC
jgi:hypothetical protein